MGLTLAGDRLGSHLETLFLQARAWQERVKLVIFEIRAPTSSPERVEARRAEAMTLRGDGENLGVTVESDLELLDVSPPPTYSLLPPCCLPWLCSLSDLRLN